MSAIDNILEERGARYGTFARHAEIAQHLKGLIFAYKNKDEYEYDQIQAMEVICDKLARIINGDHYYVDSWRDIEGYAKLVADRLEKS